MHDNRYNPQKATYNNWWDWEIGSPQSLADIITLMYPVLSAQQIKDYTDTIDRFIPDPTKRLIGSSIKRQAPICSINHWPISYGEYLARTSLLS
ncbi:hypothetical protein RE628_01935 [Paenibacillus sp. D2_2]|uniref:hypothetical protein n=1 Tax=Paenibacillus sp. D2_2 TaxID=3073092 RepID=UPI0028151671|nr:hypothetical protein [Paenibacillus sp. D2_2]WMT41359.1 hypothetical protein RE628_01935 [Paenibacillus sp. D2_2]